MSVDAWKVGSGPVCDESERYESSDKASILGGDGVTLLLLPSRVWACACCAHPGEYQIDFVKPDEVKLSVIKRIRFGTKAELWTRRGGPRGSR